MYVLTGIRQLETSPDSCLDRMARDPGHTPGSCVLGRAVGEGWQCGEPGRRGEEEQSQDMFAESEEVDMIEEGIDQEAEVQLPKNYQLMGPAVWEERTLMSPFSARPLLIAKVKESRESMTAFCSLYLDPEVHQLTHYSSDPSWREGGKGYCLWSPRVRKVVVEDECSKVEVQGKTTFKNPLKKMLSVEEEDGAGEGDKNKRLLDTRKRKREDSPVQMSNMETKMRLEAFKHMMKRGILKGARLDSSVLPKIELFKCLINK